MGFLGAVRRLGEMAGTGEALDSFLELPLPKQDLARELRVALRVTDVEETPLDVRGVAWVDQVDWWGGSDEDEVKRRRYFYREPAGSNITWSYSPVLRLGKPPASTREAWWTDPDPKKGKIAALRKRVLEAYEKEGFFSPGSVDRVVEDLLGMGPHLADLSSDAKHSHLLVVGVEEEGRFRYPGDVPAFREFFHRKTEEIVHSTGGRSKTRGSHVCALCRTACDQAISLDEIFPFATFDKKNFLPGLDDGATLKTFPLCRDCFALLSQGKGIVDERWVRARSFGKIHLSVVPEMLFGHDVLGVTSDRVENFLRNGLRQEERFFNLLAGADEGMVVHFLFWEPNQAQQRIHLMVEDVPPSRLRRLLTLWQETRRAFEGVVRLGDSLDAAIATVYRSVSDLGGKNEQDTFRLGDMALGAVGRLLGGEDVDELELRRLFVAGLPALCADAKRVSRGGWESARMAAALDFVLRTQRRIAS